MTEKAIEIKAGNKFIRKFALELLDDESGIKKKAYELFSVILVDSDNEDILENVDIANDRAFIGETFAEVELEKLKGKEDMTDDEGTSTPSS